ncbi:hypothetical protein SAMN05444340_1288 [Citreimonas salinaria]|uniref:Uncharacterized protein n=2 Tax=Citreimonas salinaria TaxID=321339 RepID=A0A1H3NPZ9_9RHOB|nr:hypothetical protein SAMN05444340_1288 [Citreimonas salinaria]
MVKACSRSPRTLTETTRRVLAVTRTTTITMTVVVMKTQTKTLKIMTKSSRAREEHDSLDRCTIQTGVVSIAC